MTMYPIGYDDECEQPNQATENQNLATNIVRD